MAIMRSRGLRASAGTISVKAGFSVSTGLLGNGPLPSLRRMSVSASEIFESTTFSRSANIAVLLVSCTMP